MQFVFVRGADIGNPVFTALLALINDGEIHDTTAESGCAWRALRTYEILRNS
jgi:hypothetical protein